MIWAEIVRMSLIHIVFIRIHVCPCELGGTVFAGCSLLLALGAKALDQKSVSLWTTEGILHPAGVACDLGFQRAFSSVARARTGKDTNPLASWMYGAAATDGSTREIGRAGKRK